MQKWIGFLMIFAGCSGLGVWYSMQFRRQLETLQEFCRILELLQGQIRFGRSTLPECCFRLGERLGEPYRSCFQDIYEKICENTGEDFGHICEVGLRKGLQQLVVDKEDINRFISCFEQSGYEEDEMQLRMLEQTKEELEMRLQKLSDENASKCRLALSLGTMSGLLLIILLL